MNLICIVSKPRQLSQLQSDSKHLLAWHVDNVITCKLVMYFTESDREQCKRTLATLVASLHT